MAVAFDSIPADVRVPFVYVEVDSSRGGAPVAAFRTLMLGQVLAAGVAPAGELIVMGGAAEADRAFGPGSQLALMVAAFRRQNPLGELWCLPLADAGGATDDTHTLTVTGPSTGSGQIAVYVSGRRIVISVANGTAAADIATALTAAINAQVGLPATAATNNAVVTVSARNGGSSLDQNVRINHQADEVLPPGVAVAVAQTVQGATDPMIATAIAEFGDEIYSLIVTPYNDAAAIAALENELATRWGPNSQLDGNAISAFRGTVAQATTYGNARNSQHSTVFDHGDCPNPTWELAAAAAGTVARAAEADPARPFQTLQLNGLLAPRSGAQRTLQERNGLLKDGMATYNVDAGGNVRLERVITTYQTNSGGAADLAYLDLNTPLTLSHLKQNFRNRIRSRYPRHKLADNDTRIGPGQPVVTPNIARAETIAWFRDMEALGLVEGAEQFKTDLVVERNVRDRNRLDFLLPPDLVNQFRVAGVRLAFLL